MENISIPHTEIILSKVSYHPHCKKILQIKYEVFKIFMSPCAVFMFVTLDLNFAH